MSEEVICASINAVEVLKYLFGKRIVFETAVRLLFLSNLPDRPEVPSNRNATVRFLAREEFANLFAWQVVESGFANSGVPTASSDTEVNHHHAQSGSRVHILYIFVNVSNIDSRGRQQCCFCKRAPIAKGLASTSKEKKG